MRENISRKCVIAGARIDAHWHTNVSATFLPDVQPSNIDLPGGAEAVFVDCPGFLDNRGASINIANAVNIKATLNASANARSIVILNYHSLKADRSRGLRELGQILTDLFGSVSRVLDNIDSLLLGVTQCPKFDDDGEERTELEDIRKLVSNGTGLGVDGRGLEKVSRDDVPLSPL